jgi:hypothetical protein
MGTTYVGEPRTIRITAESRDKKNERIVYSIVIYGPKGFSIETLCFHGTTAMGTATKSVVAAVNHSREQRYCGGEVRLFFSKQNRRPT